MKNWYHDHSLSKVEGQIWGLTSTCSGGRHNLQLNNSYSLLILFILKLSESKYWSFIVHLQVWQCKRVTTGAALQSRHSDCILLRESQLTTPTEQTAYKLSHRRLRRHTSFSPVIGCELTGKLDLCAGSQCPSRSRQSVNPDPGEEPWSVPGQHSGAQVAHIPQQISPIWKDEVGLYSAWETMLSAEWKGVF